MGGGAVHNATVAAMWLCSSKLSWLCGDSWVRVTESILLSLHRQSLVHEGREGD